MASQPKLLTNCAGTALLTNCVGTSLLGNCDTLFEMVVIYDWAGTNMLDLDTSTTFLGQTVGFGCGSGGAYVDWISLDSQLRNGFEEVHVKVDQALAAGAWAGTTTVNLKAGWYSPQGGSGPATVTVSYRGVSETRTITPGSQNGCATTAVGTVTVLANGTFTLT